MRLKSASAAADRARRRRCRRTARCSTPSRSALLTYCRCLRRRPARSASAPAARSMTRVVGGCTFGAARHGGSIRDAPYGSPIPASGSTRTVAIRSDRPELRRARRPAPHGRQARRGARSGRAARRRAAIRRPASRRSSSWAPASGAPLVGADRDPHRPPAGHRPDLAPLPQLREGVVRRGLDERVPRVGIGDPPGAQRLAHAGSPSRRRPAPRGPPVRSSHGRFSVP